MCKHILNAQVSIRAPCCRRFFDCAQCHAEVSDHELLQSDVMSLVCKKCKKAFRLDVADGVLDEAREYCPHCDNHFYRDAIEPKAAIVAENADTRHDNRLAQLRDLRMKMVVDDDDGDLFADDDAGVSTRLG